MTGRGWWTLFVIVLMLGVGLATEIASLIITALTLLLWFAWEWLRFSFRVRWRVRSLRIVRSIGDDRGPVSTLWQAREYTVKVELHLYGAGTLPYLAVADPVPFGVRHEKGRTTGEGLLRAKRPIALEYRISCPHAGAARFEGLRVEMTDLQGFFCIIVFVRDPVVLPILPAVIVGRAGGATLKRHNELLPPGLHRLKQPGSGSELLDLRDYMPGDPPRTIAWKVSARRDRLITKEFENEVPIRCTLFLDVSSSVRVPSPPRLVGKETEPAYPKPLDHMIELAAGVIRASATMRDLTGLCVFDEQHSRIVRPERGRNHQTKMMQMLGDAASLGPSVSRADPEAVLPVAYGLALEVYPELLRSEVNKVPAFVTWFVGFPRYTRHVRGWLDSLHRKKRSVVLWGTIFLPLALLITNVVLAMIDDVPEWIRTIFGTALFLGTPLLAMGAWLLFFFSILVSSTRRKHTRWRKRLAALFCARDTARSFSRSSQTSAWPCAHVCDERLNVGALDALLEDDDLFSLYLQQFLAEHQVPCALPLYDEQGRYLFALPEKIAILSKALLQSVSRARDNELYILMVDLLELDASLDPLLQAVRVALGRHHQVLLVCPWPVDLPLPGEENPRGVARTDTMAGLMQSLTTERLLAAFSRIRRAFARLSVPVMCATSEESMPAILERIERLRGAHRGGLRR